MCAVYGSPWRVRSDFRHLAQTRLDMVVGELITSRPKCCPKTVTDGSRNAANTFSQRVLKSALGGWRSEG